MGSELIEAITAILTNPNIVYLLLIIGLWAAATAVYIPGTGFPEGAAVVCLALALVGLVQLPTRVIGVLLIVVSSILFLIDLKVHSVGITVGGVLCIVLGSVFLFRPDADIPATSTARLSSWLIALVALSSLVFFGGALAAVLRTQRLKAIVDAGAIVGQIGVLVAPTDPVGTVQVQSELWTAVSDTVLNKGEKVRIVSLEGLKLHVTSTDTPDERG